MYLYVLFYILALISFGELAKFRIKDNPNFYKVTYWGVVCVIIFLSTFRWENGTDWSSYYEYYIQVGVSPESGYLEFGYTWLCSINYQLANGSYTFHLGIMALLCILPVAKRIKQYSPFPFFSLFIWFCVIFAHLFPVRQTIAISLFVFSWKYIIERKWYFYLVTIIIATTFHYTALITLPFYFLCKKYIPAKYIMCAIAIVFVMAVTTSHLFSNLLFIFGGDFFESKLSYYMDQSNETFGMIYSPIQVMIRGCVNRSFYFFIPLFLLNAIRKNDYCLNAFFNMYLYSFILFLITVPLSVALARLTVFTDMAQIMLLPYIFTMRMNRGTVYIIVSLLIIYFFIRFNGIVMNYYDVYIPYKFCFFI